MKRAQIDEIVKQRQPRVFTRLLDSLRRQLAGVDTLPDRSRQPGVPRPRETATITGGTIHRPTSPAASPGWPPVADAFTISVSLRLALTRLGAPPLQPVHRRRGHRERLRSWGSAGSSDTSGFGFLYYLIGLVLTGRSIGKGCGAARRGRDDAALARPAASSRVLVYPISFILWIGLVPIVTGQAATGPRTTGLPAAPSSTTGATGRASCPAPDHPVAAAPRHRR